MSQPECGRYRALTAEAAQSRLESFDIYDPTLPPVVHDVLEHGRRTCPVAYSPANGGFYLVTRYEDVTAVLRDDATFSSAHGKSLPHQQTVLMPPLDSDPPLHGEFRRLLNPYLSRPGLKPFTAAVRDTAGQTAAALLGRGECDVYADFAAR